MKCSAKWRRRAEKTNHALRTGKYFGSNRDVGLGMQRARIRLGYVKPPGIVRRVVAAITK